MRLAIVGLGRMGANMARRLLRAGHEVVVSNRSREPVDELASEGAVPAYELDDVAGMLEPPRVAWTMLPAGDVTEDAIRSLAGVMAPGDVLVDGANSFYRDSMRRGQTLSDRGVGFCDAGVSGGVWGLESGYCVMVGGAAEHYELIRPACESLAEPGGAVHVGPVGAGHFTKMVHNGIEYGMLHAYAEGFELMHAAEEFDLDLHAIAELWGHGSVVRSWLLDLLVTALRDDVGLDAITGWVDDSGEGRWTVQDAVERGVPLTVIAHSLFARFSSRQDDSFAMRVIAALRQGFGGHTVRPTEDL